MMKNRWVKTVVIFLLFQLLLLVSFKVSQLYSSKPTFRGWEIKEARSLPEIAWSRINFDGLHYIKIAQSGYGALQEAFFPLYPQLIRFLQPLWGNYTLAALFISNLALLCLIYLIQLIFPKKGFWFVLVFLTFPAAFYFGCAYTEALFLLLALLCYYLVKQKLWLPAALAAGLASATRVVGIFLVPVIVLEYLQKQNGKPVVFIKSGLLAVIGSIGLLKYMIYLKRVHNDWLYFAHVQKDFGAGRTTDRLILLPQVFWRYLKMIVTVGPSQHLYFNVWLEFITAAAFCFLLFKAWQKRQEYDLKTSWLIFATVSFLLPTLTGNFSSLPRYVLVCWPCFRLIGQWLTKQNKLIKVGYLLVSSTGFIILASLFMRGLWVA